MPSLGDGGYSYVFLLLVYVRTTLDVIGVVLLGSACLGRRIPYARFFKALPVLSLAFFLALFLPVVHTYRIALAFVFLSLLITRLRLLSAFHASGAALLGMAFLSLLDVSFGQLMGRVFANFVITDFVSFSSAEARLVYSLPVAIVLALAGFTAQSLLRRIRSRRGERRRLSGYSSSEVDHRDFLTMTQLFVGLLIVSSLARTPAAAASPIAMMLSPLLVFSIILGGHYVQNTTRCDTRRLAINLLETLALGLLVVYIVLHFGFDCPSYRLLLIPLVVTASLKPAPIVGGLAVVGSVAFLASLAYSGDTAAGGVISAADGIYIATVVIVWWLVRGFIRSEYALRSRLEHQAITDPLTGVYNRRYLFDYLDSIPPADLDRTFLIMLDIDDFKSINDTHGHGFGDDVLKAVAGGIRTAVRSEELVARYGGDEFVVVVRDAEKQPALVIAQRIGAALGALTISPVTPRFSIGIASGDTRHSGRALFARADQELYRAKRAGKNVVSCEGTLHSPTPSGSEGVLDSQAVQGSSSV